MRKFKAFALIMLVVISSAVLVQASTASLFLNNGFQALFYHAIGLEDSIPGINPVGIAIKEFEKAALDGSSGGEARLMMGLIYQYLNRPGTALGYYLEFAQEHPDEVWVHSFIGDMYAEMGRLNEAERSYEQAILGASEGEIFAQAYVGLGNTALERGHYEQAKEAFEKALNSAGGYFDARLGLGKTLYLMEEYSEAIATLEVAQMQGPRSIPMLYFLGMSYEAAGLQEQADHAFLRLDELRQSQ